MAGISVNIEEYYCGKVDDMVNVYVRRKPVKEVSGRVFVNTARICDEGNCPFMDNEKECPLEYN